MPSACHCLNETAQKVSLAGGKLLANMGLMIL